MRCGASIGTGDGGLRPDRFQLLNPEGYSMLTAFFAIGAFAFGLVLAGGLIDDGMIKPLTDYWVGMALLVPSMIACVFVAIRRINHTVVMIAANEATK
jgi:hypothetical protein